MATGTVVPLHTYPESDPVVAFYRKERDEDLAGQKWNPEADCEYLRKAMKGLGNGGLYIIDDTKVTKNVNEYLYLLIIVINALC